MIKEHVQIKEMKSAMSDVYQSIEYVEEYGHVGCFDATPEEIKEMSEKALELIQQANDWLETIGEKIKNSYEY